jgi:transposase
VKQLATDVPSALTALTALTACSESNDGAEAQPLSAAACKRIGVLNRREIGKLVGVAPLANDSGKHRGKRQIWGGRMDVRNVLYMGTSAAMRHNPVIREFAQRLKAAGKPPNVVIVACMRKLLTIMNTLVKTSTAWNPGHNVVAA